MYFQGESLTWLASWCRIGLRIQLGLRDRALDSSHVGFSLWPRLPHSMVAGFQYQTS